MTAKEYLNQIRQSEIFIKQRSRELERIKESRIYIPGINYAKDRVQTSPEGGNIQSERIIDLELEIVDSIKTLNFLRHEIICKIQQMPDTRYSQILYLRYVEYKSIQDIALDLNYEYTYCCELHTKALDNFDELYLHKPS